MKPLSAEARLHAELAACGVFFIIWTVLPHGLWHHAGFLILAWPITRYALRVRRATTQVASRDEWRDGLAYPRAMPFSRVSADAFIGTVFMLGGLWAAVWLYRRPNLAEAREVA